VLFRPQFLANQRPSYLVNTERRLLSIPLTESASADSMHIPSSLINMKNIPPCESTHNRFTLAIGSNRLEFSRKNLARNCRSTQLITNKFTKILPHQSGRVSILPQIGTFLKTGLETKIFWSRSGVSVFGIDGNFGQSHDNSKTPVGNNQEVRLHLRYYSRTCGARITIMIRFLRNDCSARTVLFRAQMPHRGRVSVMYEDDTLKGSVLTVRLCRWCILNSGYSPLEGDSPIAR